MSSPRIIYHNGSNYVSIYDYDKLKCALEIAKDALAWIYYMEKNTDEACESSEPSSLTKHTGEALKAIEELINDSKS